MNSKAINNHSKILLLFYFYVISPFVFTQELYTLKRIDSPNSIILSEIENFKKNRFGNSSTKLDSTSFNLSFNINFVRNNGHPNIDNSSKFLPLENNLN